MTWRKDRGHMLARFGAASLADADGGQGADVVPRAMNRHERRAAWAVKAAKANIGRIKP